MDALTTAIQEQHNGSYSVRPMRAEDIPQITEIDREVFPSQWPPPAHTFKRELKNQLASYIVAIENGSSWENTKGTPISFFDPLIGLFRRRPSKRHAPQETEYIAGFAGFWRMVDEAHITTLAVRKSHRQRGIGELLIIHLLELALQCKQTVSTLEVRASNYEAQALYSKYGFKKVGIRKGYYTEDKEDAVIMTIDPITSTSYKERFRELKEKHLQRMTITYAEPEL